MINAETKPIDIAAPPERVRELVLDFANMPTWHTQHFKSIVVPSGKAGKELVEGDKLEVKLTPGLNFNPTIKENTPQKFRWLGGVSAIFTGEHCFEFLPSETIPGGTKVLHYEIFKGGLSFTMDPDKKKSGQMNMEGFEAFNHDLKTKAEEMFPLARFERKEDGGGAE